MPSPFPGMDPFIEGQLWEDFHHEFIREIRHQLVPLLKPKYVTVVEKRIYIDLAGDDETLQVVADVGIATGRAGSYAGSGAVATAEQPVVLDYPIAMERRESYLTIRDAANRNIVSIIEILSPANKRAGSVGREEYLKKREAILGSDVNLVELDLLRGGERLPMARPLPPGDYFAVIRTPGRRQAGVFAWRLADRLPVVGVPLMASDPEVKLDLAAAFDDAYDHAGYDATLNYQLSITPPLSAKESAWVGEVVGSRRQAN